MAHISDLHVRKRGTFLPHIPQVGRPLRRALRTVHEMRERPSFIIATGDLTEHGTLVEYRRLRSILDECEIPVFLLPGNHDSREALRAVFDDHSYLHGPGSGIQYAIDSELLRVVALDSSEPSHRGGFFDDERLDWLESRLCERPGTPTILAMHHPPFTTRVGAFDAQGFEGRERLAAIVRTNPQIRRIVCGHVHQMISRPWCGTLAVSAPSTAPTLALHVRGGVRWEPGGLLLHHYDWDADVTTHLLRVSAEPVSLGA